MVKSKTKKTWKDKINECGVKEYIYHILKI